MLCPSCKDKPIVRGLKSIKCLHCGKDCMVNAGYKANICDDCSNELVDCICCGKGIQKLKVFYVERTDEPFYCEDISSIVVAVDAMWAEKLVRLSSSSMRKAPLKVTEVDLTQEGVLLTDNIGA